MKFYLSGIFACLLCASWARADSITTGDGNGADSFVRSNLGGNNAANQNYGASSAIEIKHDTAIPGNNRKGYLRFDLSSLTGSIVAVSLDLAFVSASPDAGANPSTYSVFGLMDGHAGESWDETTITWNNAPGNNTSSSGGVLGSETTFLGAFNLSFPAAAGVTVSFSSAAMLTFLQGDTNGLVTFIITRQQQNFRTEGFAAHENTAYGAPTLQFTTQSVPEPSSLALSLMGAAVAAVARSRRGGRGTRR